MLHKRAGLAWRLCVQHTTGKSGVSRTCFGAALEHKIPRNTWSHNLLGLAFGYFLLLISFPFILEPFSYYLLCTLIAQPWPHTRKGEFMIYISATVPHKCSHTLQDAQFFLVSHWQQATKIPDSGGSSEGEKNKQLRKHPECLLTWTNCYMCANTSPTTFLSHYPSHTLHSTLKYQ